MQAGPFRIDAVHQDVLACSYLCLKEVPADVLLQLHEYIAAFNFDMIFHLVRKGGCLCAFLRPEGEDAKLRKAGFFHKVAQMPEMGVCFARVADNEGGAQGSIRDGFPYFVADFFRLDSKGPAHVFQDVRMAVLQGHVEVGQK